MNLPPLRCWEVAIALSDSPVDSDKKDDIKAAFRGAQALQRLGKRDPDVPSPPKWNFAEQLEKINNEVLVNLRRVPARGMVTQYDNVGPN